MFHKSKKYKTQINKLVHALPEDTLTAKSNVLKTDQNVEEELLLKTRENTRYQFVIKYTSIMVLWNEQAVSITSDTSVNLHSLTEVEIYSSSGEGHTVLAGVIRTLKQDLADSPDGEEHGGRVSVLDMNLQTVSAEHPAAEENEKCC